MPTVMDYFCSRSVVVTRVQCGFDHSVAVCTEGRLYGWGSNRNGKCGIGDCKINFVTTPQRIDVLELEHNRIYHEHFIPSVMAQITIDPLRQRNDGGGGGDGGGDTVDMLSQYRSEYAQQQHGGDHGVLEMK